MTKIFILEDSQNRIALFKSKLGMHDLTVAETATEAIKILGEQKFDIMFFDHDLGGGEMMSNDDTNTGSEVARWLVSHYDKTQFEFRCPVIVHSLNPDGSNNIIKLLESIGFKCIRVPFTQLNREMDNPLFIS